jgi:prepilin-type N-terminal cleavage/methylation domain-containing protein
MTLSSRHRAGFSLTEIIIAIAIIAIFITLPALAFTNYLKQSRDEKRKTDINNIQAALETYKAENGVYPVNLDTLVQEGYMSEIPVDPLQGQIIPGTNGLETYGYEYRLSPDGLSYELIASLEGGNTVDDSGGGGGGGSRNIYVVNPRGPTIIAINPQQTLTPTRSLPTRTPTPSPSPIISITTTPTPTPIPCNATISCTGTCQPISGKCAPNSYASTRSGCTYTTHSSGSSCAPAAAPAQACTITSQSCSSPMPQCESSTSTCRQCLSNSHCTSASASRCSSYTCQGCLSASDCTHIGSTASCVSGVCIIPTNTPTPIPQSPVTSNLALQTDASCFRMTTGIVRCWGSAYYGGTGDASYTHRNSAISVTSASGVLSGVSQVSKHCALLNTGQIRCWGVTAATGGSIVSDLYIQTVASGLANVTQISTHDPVSGCALISNGTVRCWGRNDYGQLGNGTTTDSSTPVQVSGITNATQVSLGAAHACARLADSTVRCWGYNFYGQLGNGTNTNSTVPVTVTGLTGVTQVSAGGGNTCARLVDGTLRCWGYNFYGQLGNGTTTSSYTPVQVSGITTASEVFMAHGWHACARLSDGTARCWGWNGMGQLGNGTTTNSSTPVTVSGLTGVTGIALGYEHTCTTINDGSVRCWGENDSYYGKLGDATYTNRTTPVTVSSLTGITQLDAGQYHTCAIRNDGVVRCWGYNGNGQLGDGTNTQRNSPVSATGFTGATDLDAGTDITCARIYDGTVRCVGWNAFGQLGNGTTNTSYTPVTVSGLTNIVHISTKGNHVCAVDSNYVDSTARCWGANASGQLGDGTTTNRSTPVGASGLTSTGDVAAGSLFTCIRNLYGWARCWGNNASGQLGDGTNTSRTTPGNLISSAPNIKQLEAGQDFVCGLITDGTIKCWGNNTPGQLGNGTNTNSNTPVTVSGISTAVQIGVGSNHACAVLSDSTVRCWGSNSWGQLGDGSTVNRNTPVTVSGLTNVARITLGDVHTCAHMRDGTARCWGYNGYGQLGDGTTTNRLSPVTVTGL